MNLSQSPRFDIELVSSFEILAGWQVNAMNESGYFITSQSRCANAKPMQSTKPPQGLPLYAVVSILLATGSSESNRERGLDNSR